jgi:hypothetical protein
VKSTHYAVFCSLLSLLVMQVGVLGQGTRPFLELSIRVKTEDTEDMQSDIHDNMTFCEELRAYFPCTVILVSDATGRKKLVYMPVTRPSYTNPVYVLIILFPKYSLSISQRNYFVSFNFIFIILPPSS